jgi:uncharacterized damage-inducible protein DinB
MEQATSTADLRYPAGRFQAPTTISADDRVRLIEEIAQLPQRLRAAVEGLSDAQLATPYREGGWTVRQVVHHLADSHMNSFVRFKLALTEDAPTIKPYKEAAWAETQDARNAPLDPSLALIEGLHERWVALLKSLGDSEYQRVFRHPERGEMRLDVNLALYAWHCRHHLAHIESLRRRMGW